MVGWWSWFTQSLRTFWHTVIFNIKYWPSPTWQSLATRTRQRPQESLREQYFNITQTNTHSHMSLTKKTEREDLGFPQIWQKSNPIQMHVGKGISIILNTRMAHTNYLTLCSDYIAHYTNSLFSEMLWHLISMQYKFQCFIKSCFQLERLTRPETPFFLLKNNSLMYSALWLAVKEQLWQMTSEEICLDSKDQL